MERRLDDNLQKVGKIKAKSTFYERANLPLVSVHLPAPSPSPTIIRWLIVLPVCRIGRGYGKRHSKLARQLESHLQLAIDAKVTAMDRLMPARRQLWARWKTPLSGLCTRFGALRRG